MCVKQQTAEHAFSYGKFKSQLLSEALTSAQFISLNQHLDILKSFISLMQIETLRKKGKKTIDQNETN